MRKNEICIFAVFLTFAPFRTVADQTMHRFEADTLPHDASAGWIIADSCDPPCSESLGNGRFRLDWAEAADAANYHLWISQSPTQPPPTLWVEWRFRSNHPTVPWSFNCDGHFVISYKDSLDGTHMYADKIISLDGSLAMTVSSGLFHTFRFESIDGSTYTYASDGQVFFTRMDDAEWPHSYLQMGGKGGCGNDQVPNMINEWDFVRYGTLGTNEQVVSTVPVSGALGPGAYTSFTSFLVTFDQPNYVYIDDIAVSVTGGVAPIVTATRRTDTHDEHTVEIVLDRALPQSELTTFTMSDGQTTNFINYDFRPNPSAIPTSSASGLLTLTLVLCAAGYLILRGRAVRPL